MATPLVLRMPFLLPLACRDPELLARPLRESVPVRRWGVGKGVLPPYLLSSGQWPGFPLLCFLRPRVTGRVSA